MNVEVSQIDLPLTAGGTAQGAVTISSTAGFLPGAFCQLYDTMGNSLTVQITDIPSSTVLNLRIAAQPGGQPAQTAPQQASTAVGSNTLTQNLPPNYGRSNVSAFLVANGARICQNAQSVRTEPAAQAAPLL
jgi:hypothetical protein